MITSLLDSLETISSSHWFYLAIFAIALLDSIVPIVPSETTVILGGIAAGQGHLLLVLVILLGAFGAFAGDNIAYWLGRRADNFLQRTALRREKQKKQLAWAAKQLEKRGGLLLVTARFIPGGRTAITISSGLTKQDYSRFLSFDLLACFLWATYAGVLGRVFGAQFKDDHTKAFMYAFIAALSVTVLIEAIRWFRHRNDMEDNETIDAQPTAV